MYVLAAASGGYYVAGRLLGAFHSAQDFAFQYFVDPSGIYLTARVLTALLGTLGVLVVYKVGKRYFGERQGMVAGALLAVLPLHASYSHIAVTDIAHATLIGATWLPLYGVLERGRRRDYVTAGALIGLGAATKYLAVLHVGSLVVAHWLGSLEPGTPWWSPIRKLRTERVRSLAVALGLAVVVFFAASPYNLIQFGRFVHDFRVQSELSRGDGVLHSYLLHALVPDLGWPAIALVVTGVVSLLRRPTREALVLGTFPLLYCIVLLPNSNLFARYLLPQSFFFALCAGQGWAVIHRGAEQGRRPAVGMALANALLVVALAVPACKTLSWDWFQTAGIDSRDRALAWTEQNIPVGTPIVIESIYGKTFENVPLVTDESLAHLEHILPSSPRFAAMRAKILDHWRAYPTYVDRGWEKDPRELAADGVKYVYLTATAPPAPAPMQQWLDRDCRTVASFLPELPFALRDQPELGRSGLPMIPPALTVCKTGP
jgi:4-amino-4-deoxy-L-arabinose transferase-like glycosyltransferase